MKQLLLLILLALAGLTSCSKSTAATYTAVKPKYHHSWYKNHIYKKKWHVGRVRVRFEKQGVKKVKMKG